MSKEKIIFTTKDGYDITEGMKYYSVKVKEYETHPDIKKLKGFKKPPVWSMCGPYINPKAHEPTGDIEYFYKKENAVEFINQNKDDYSFTRVSVEERQRERSDKYDYLIGDDDDIKQKQR